MTPARRLFFFLFFLFCVSILGLIIWTNFQVFRGISRIDLEQADQLWKSGELGLLMERVERNLKYDPLDFYMLRYGGYACFHLGLNSLSEEEKSRYFSRSVFYLRKALVLRMVSGKLEGEIYYVLGKAYYYSGFSMLSSAIEALQWSIQEGYWAADIYEFLADAYRRLGKNQESVYYFEQFDLEEVSDRFLLAYAKSLMGIGENVKAGKMLERAQESTKNQLLLTEIMLQLAQVYYNMEQWERAQKMLQAVLKEQELAKAHFLLGEIYNKMKQPVQARREWRSAIRLDENYKEAYERLQN